MASAKVYGTAFESAIEIVLKNEGGYEDHPNDPGGATKYGITLKTLQGKNPKATKETVKNLTTDEAKEIYYDNYWKKYHYDGITSEAIAIKAFDTGVNVGPGTAIKFLQKACNKLGCNIQEDGGLGKASFEALSKVIAEHGERKLLEEFRTIQIAHYNKLVEQNPKLSVFLKGWINRANR